MGDVTQILNAIPQDDVHTSERLLLLVYDELRVLAAQRMANERPGQTLQATALVHDAYLRLMDARGDEREWDGRGHFFAAAAEAMRRILVENARRRNSAKRGGDRQRVDLHQGIVADVDSSIDLLALDRALTRLEAEQPAAAEVVKHRYFAGLSIKDTADLMGISVRTANRHWAYAKAFLYKELHT